MNSVSLIRYAKTTYKHILRALFIKSIKTPIDNQNYHRYFLSMIIGNLK